MAGKGVVYLLHFDEPISDGHTTQHYMGWSEEIQARMNAHRNGQGARLTEVAAERGIAFEIVRLWAGSRSDERRLKNNKNHPKYCPLCAARAANPRNLQEVTDDVTLH